MALLPLLLLKGCLLSRSHSLYCDATRVNQALLSPIASIDLFTSLVETTLFVPRVMGCQPVSAYKIMSKNTCLLKHPCSLSQLKECGLPLLPTPQIFLIYVIDMRPKNIIAILLLMGRLSSQDITWLLLRSPPSVCRTN